MNVHFHFPLFYLFIYLLHILTYVHKEPAAMGIEEVFLSRHQMGN